MEPISPPQSPASYVRPLLTQGAIERTGDVQLPGDYCAQRHVWLVNGAPIVAAMSDLAELATKTLAQMERDDTCELSLLELQTKTKAEVEQDDQDLSINELGLATTILAGAERDNSREP
jgi:hypothetical protein